MSDRRFPIPDNEPARLARLHTYGILDTPREQGFDHIVDLAARLLGVPIALISLIDAERSWLKAKVGIEGDESHREVAFCAHTIIGNDVMVVEDATSDRRFMDNPLVRGEPRIRFYAGAPLTTSDGFNLGTLCAIDKRPRSLSSEQAYTLESLAGLAMELIEARRGLERARVAETRLVDAVEALSDGFVLYDSDDRLSLCNARYLQIYAQTAPALVPGNSFEEVIRYGVEHGQYPEARGREEEWVRERLVAHRQPGPPIEQELPGDRWLRIEERRTRDGGYVGFRVDITKLKRQQRELERLAATDCLTGALSRRRFLEVVEAEAARCCRTGEHAAILAVDADHFKRVNDTFGHAAGDDALVALVAAMRHCLRDYDQIGRFGGEEFVVLLPGIDLDAALLAAERIRSEIAKTAIRHGEHQFSITSSIGVTIIAEEPEAGTAAMARADKALYLAKNQGRNRVAYHLHGQDADGGTVVSDTSDGLPRHT